MKTRKDCFAWLLDRLSGTYPNDERTSHINEQGFALVGFFYIFAMAARSVYGLVQNWRGVKSYMPMPELWSEGGYEIEDANLCYGLPAPWKRDVTARILDAVDRLAAGYDADNQTEKGR